MANINNVNYAAIPGQAQQIRTYGEQLNGELTSAYNSIASMHNSWYGTRYNALVKEFNKMIPEINVLLDLVVGEIPFALETIANNYSQYDKGSNVTSACKTAPKKIVELTVSSDVGMKFISSEVSTTQSNVTKNFDKAKELMNTIETAYGKIEWKSEASEAFSTRFRKIKNDIVEAFNNINSQFAKLMNQTLEDIQATESANTVQ